MMSSGNKQLTFVELWIASFTLYWKRFVLVGRSFIGFPLFVYFTKYSFEAFFGLQECFPIVSVFLVSG